MKKNQRKRTQKEQRAERRDGQEENGMEVLCVFLAAEKAKQIAKLLLSTSSSKILKLPRKRRRANWNKLLCCNTRYDYEFFRVFPCPFACLACAYMFIRKIVDSEGAAQIVV